MHTEDQSHAQSGSSTLFAPQPRTAAGAAAIESLQALRASVHDADEQALRALGMLPIDALAVRHLVLARRDGRTVSPTRLARAMRLSTAGITKLLDRLVRDGRAERQPNPKDRRSLIIVPVGTAEDDLARAHEHIHAPVVAAIDALSDADIAAVHRFAAHLADAIRGKLTATSTVPAT
jgi:DNA-binding MarR family transcriptional regulator